MGSSHRTGTERESLLARNAALSTIRCKLDFPIILVGVVMRHLLHVALFASFVLCGCAKSVPPSVPANEAATYPVWFEDITAKAGLTFVHDPNVVGKYFMPESMGSGCAMFDADGDGRLDILLLNNAGTKSKSTNALYRQKADGTFEDITVGCGLDYAGWCMGVAVGDVNNDGLPDAVITEYGGTKLFLNLGGGKFADVTVEAGIQCPQWGASAAFVDTDRDGWLDLAIVNYVEYDPSKDCPSANGKPSYCSPKSFPGSPSRLYRNRGTKRPSFEDVSLSSGIGTLPAPGLGVYAADLTGDGWPDLFVANDGKPNFLWVNQKNGTFKEEAVSRGAAYTFMGQAFAGMGIAAGDVDNDGLVDLYVTHLGLETNTLWKQGPRGIFRDRTAEAGLTATKWRGTGFGTLMADFDADGSLDMAIVNGRVTASGNDTNTGVPKYWEPFAERNQLLANDGTGKFRDISEANKSFCERFNVGRGLACGDIDGDGAPDLLVNAIGEPAKLYRNVCPNRGSWLQIRAFDPKLNRDAYGAEMRVVTGAITRLRIVGPADSILSSSSPVVNFGLGKVTSIDSIQVNWPDGVKENFPGGETNQTRTIRKGEGQPSGI